MRSKFFWLALAISVAMTAPTQGNDHRAGRDVAAGPGGSARSSAGAVRSMPRGNFGGGRPIVATQHFSAIGARPPQTAFRHSNVSAISGASIGQRFTPRTFNRDDRLTRFSNRSARIASLEDPGGDRFGQIRNGNRGVVSSSGDALTGQHVASRTLNRGDNSTRFMNSRTRLASVESRTRDRFGQIANGNRGFNTTRQHVFARRSANWHPDWDRSCDHWWNGHCCRFINGFWVIFDLGFYPWWPSSYPYWYGYPYGYPYDYYPSYYSYGYPSGYDPGPYDQSDADYYGRGRYNSPDQYSDRTVVAAQTQLAKDGYYRGEIDGILGPETRRAIVSFQSDHGLRVTGNLSQETLSTLGL